MSLAENIRAVGSKVRAKMAVPPQTAADISVRLRKAREALGPAMTRREQTAIESVGLSTLTEEGRAARERDEAAAAKVKEIEGEIERLTIALAAASHREAADALRDADAAKKARLGRFDALRRELLADGAVYTAALTIGGPVGAVPAFRRVLLTTEKLMVGLLRPASQRIEQDANVALAAGRYQLTLQDFVQARMWLVGVSDTGVSP